MSVSAKFKRDSGDFIEVFFSSSRREFQKRFDAEIDYIVLLPNSWNDFNMQNMYNVVAVKKNKWIELGRARLVFRSSHSSVQILETQAVAKQGRLSFPLSRDLGQYWFLPETVEVYERLLALFTTQSLLFALGKLHDIVVSQEYKFLEDAGSDDGRLVQVHSSLIRGTTERRAVLRGKVLFGDDVEKLDENKFSLGLVIERGTQPLDVEFSFGDEWPSDRIVVLTGPNGSGKTQVLQSLVRQLVNRGKPRGLSIESLSKSASFGQVTAISYSIHDAFPPDEFDPRGKDQTYLHFGYYTKQKRFAKKAAFGRAAYAFQKIIEDTESAQYSLDVERFSAMLQALQIGLNFNEVIIAHRVEGRWVRDVVVRQAQMTRDARKLIRVEMIDPRLEFGLDGEILKLSAGQSQFCLQVVVLSAYLASKSLIIIDEPEVGLHPQLEVQYVRTLKSLLVRFSSFAIIATHSPIFVREVKSENVRVLGKIENHRSSRRPRTQTFGADVTAISNEIFGDSEVTPAFEDELEAMSLQSNSIESFIERFGDEISAEAKNFVANAIYNK